MSAELIKRIEELERKVRDLEARPIQIPIVVIPGAPSPTYVPVPYYPSPTYPAYPGWPYGTTWCGPQPQIGASGGTTS